jgi:hypothetical protein
VVPFVFPRPLSQLVNAKLQTSFISLMTCYIMIICWYLGHLQSLFFCRYILVYPQGCDVSNHLSLFLCVANHDKHLPGLVLVCCNFCLHNIVSPKLFYNRTWHFSGWSQFAQFTIAVGNLDPKKVKYSGKNQFAVFLHRAKQPIRS